MEEGALGRTYEDGEVIMRQGELGDSMYVVQEGRIRVYVEKDGQEVLLREPGEDEVVIGEMALLGSRVRSATVRAHGRARVLTIDRKAFLRRVHEDPSLALEIVRTLSRRVRDLSDEIVRLRGSSPGGRS
jgi:CRP/FNR family cyclic AMP-dependent transcriptional regulator